MAPLKPMAPLGCDAENFGDALLIFVINQEEGKEDFKEEEGGYATRVVRLKRCWWVWRMF